MKPVLLVVDVQQALLDAHPYNEKTVVANIKEMISFCREHSIEVIYIQHDDKEGDLAKGADGWKIAEEVKPNADEKIFDKEYSSSFVKTGLKEYLVSKEVDSIILVGMQTEYCMDATCKAAFEHGFQVYVPEQTNTTFDNEFLSGEKLYQFINFTIWNNRFAKVLPIQELKETLAKN